MAGCCAMYLAKDEGKNDVRFYSREMKAPSTKRLVLEASLRHALKRDEFAVYYQPKRDFKTEKISGAEAMLRWNHPDLGFFPPNQCPRTEEIGSVIPIGLWALEDGVPSKHGMAAPRTPPMSMAVNLSPRQFIHDDLLTSIDELLAETGMPGAAAA